MPAVIVRLSAFAIAMTSLLPAVGRCQDIKVTLLGTGCPPPVMSRFGPSILVEAGTQKFLVDAGRGALQRLTQQKLAWRDIQGVFLTHLHSDHIVGLPDLWLTGWLTGLGRDSPLSVWGPRGTRRMMSNLERAFEFDIAIRVSDDKAVPAGARIQTRDIVQGLVLERDGVRVVAFEVDHRPVKPAFGYRVERNGRSVVLSGDTRASDNLIRYAQGADVLIHEVVSPEALKKGTTPPDRARSIIEHHTTPEQAGSIFANTKPRLAVYSHIVPPTAAAKSLIDSTRKTYGGPLEVGEDLMVIEVGERVDVRRLAGSDQCDRVSR